MSFGIDQSVLYIKLTDKGRQKLSQGKLTFKKYGIGDSEIDYKLVDTGTTNPDTSKARVLRPMDTNPDILSFVKKENVEKSDYRETIPLLNSNISIITNTVEPKGLFTIDGSTITIRTDESHVKQPDMMIQTSTVTGGRSLTIKKSPSYLGNTTEPVVGDYLLVKWANPELGKSTTSFSVNDVIPYLWYKITSKTGTLAANTLVINVDRDVPNFNGQGSSYHSGALVYPNNNNRDVNGNSIQNYYGKPYITDFLTEAMLSFIENYDTPTIEVPVWNLSIVFAEEIDGVLSGNTSFKNIPTNKYVGFVNYIQQLDKSIRKIGIIHYTNSSPSNNYGEGLHETTPIVDIPTIMWHKKSSATLGVKLSGDTASKAILPNLNTTYHNLVDEDSNVVGKLFNDLKIFVIEDQELLMAMSYKSNRSWTLPKININFNVVNCD